MSQDPPRERAARFAWNWFEYHASQRMRMLRFFFIFLGLIGAGFVAAIQSGDSKIAGTVAAVGSIISLAFWWLDARSATLVKLAEDVLEWDQDVMAHETGQGSIRIIEQSNQAKSRRFRSFSLVLSFLFIIIGILFAVAAFYGFFVLE